jgi:hypothetical protein
MTLRDWFAGLALAGSMADPSCVSTHEKLAANCYAVADAMLAARHPAPDNL